MRAGGSLPPCSDDAFEWYVDGFIMVWREFPLYIRWLASLEIVRFLFFFLFLTKVVDESSSSSLHGLSPCLSYVGLWKLGNSPNPAFSADHVALLFCCPPHLTLPMLSLLIYSFKAWNSSCERPTTSNFSLKLQCKGGWAEFFPRLLQLFFHYLHL